MSHNLIEEPTLWKAFFSMIFVSGDDKQVHGNISTGTVRSTSAPDEASPSIGASVPLQTSAVKRSIGSTTGFHNHGEGEGPY